MSEYERNNFLDKLSKKYNLCRNIIVYLLNIKSENKFKKNRRDLWYISDPIGWEELFDYVNLEKSVYNNINKSVNKNSEKTIYI